jgi:hypothetical protein
MTCSSVDFNHEEQEDEEPTCSLRALGSTFAVNFGFSTSERVSIVVAVKQHHFR